MEVLTLLFYALALFLTFKFVKNSWLEVAILIGISLACKKMIGDGSFYPLFAMPVLLVLRHSKPFSLLYTFVMITAIGFLSGFGSWTVGQYLIYGAIFLGTFGLRNILNKQNKVAVFAYNFVAMFMFGVLMDVFTFYTGNFLGYPNVFAQVVAGIPFDIKYATSGVMYGTLSMAIAYIASVNLSDIIQVKKMTLVKQA